MTKTVTLRDVRDDDLAMFFEHQMDSTANHMVAFTTRDPTDREAFMAHWAKITSDADVTIKTIDFDGQVAGYVAEFEREGKREVCYFLGKEFWGNGIATTALSQLLEQVTMRPLYAGVAEDNVASRRVLEKCGFAVIEKKRSFAKARGEEIAELVLTLKS